MLRVSSDEKGNPKGSHIFSSEGAALDDRIAEIANRQMDYLGIDIRDPEKMRASIAFLHKLKSREEEDRKNVRREVIRNTITWIMAGGMAGVGYLVGKKVD